MISALLVCPITSLIVDTRRNPTNTECFAFGCKVIKSSKINDEILVSRISELSRTKMKGLDSTFLSEYMAASDVQY